MTDRHGHQLYVNDVARRAEEKIAARLAADTPATPAQPMDDQTTTEPRVLFDDEEFERARGPLNHNTEEQS